jgi:hypothetical protein
MDKQKKKRVIMYMYAVGTLFLMSLHGHQIYLHRHDNAQWKKGDANVQLTTIFSLFRENQNHV